MQDLTADFDAYYGVFNSKSVDTSDDIAWIIGGLNSLVWKGSDASAVPATDMLVAFYEGTISLAGLQLSAPPDKSGAMSSEWEHNLPGVIYYHPVNTPPLPMAGKLTVPAEEISWGGSTWTVTSDWFAPAGVMHLANELNSLGPHLGSIPFPSVAE